MKSDFSENYKATSVSSGLNLNLIINKTTSSSKKSKISSNQINLRKKIAMKIWINIKKVKKIFLKQN